MPKALPVIATRAPLVVRVSYLPTLLACAPSGGGGLSIDTNGEPARLGTATHAGLGHFVGTGQTLAADALADRYGLEDPDELDQLLDYGRAAWGELKRFFPAPMVEQTYAAHLPHPVAPVLLRGHVDVTSLVADGVRILDWKTGRKRRDYRDQLLGYAALASLALGVRKATITTVWLRERVATTETVEAADMKALCQRVVAAAAGRNGSRFVTGEQCENCPRATQCPARSALLVQARRDLAGIQDGQTVLDLAAAGKLGQLWTAAKMLGGLVEQFQKLVKAQLATGGPIQQPDGGRFALDLQDVRQLDAALAWPVLADLLPDEAIKGLAKLGITAALDAAGATAARGQGAATRRAVAQQLEAVGALTRTTRERVSYSPGAK